MSTGRNNRKKLKKRLKREFGPNFKREYDRVIQQEWGLKHPLIGSLADILGVDIKPHQQKILDNL